MKLVKKNISITKLNKIAKEIFGDLVTIFEDDCDDMEKLVF